MQNIHGETVRAALNFGANGDNIIVPAVTLGEIFVHEIVGDASAVVTMTVKAGARVLGIFNLAADQGITLTDIPSMGGEPRFKCFQGEAFILSLSGAVPFQGSISYSFKM